jgi:hypothetical protein
MAAAAAVVLVLVLMLMLVLVLVLRGVACAELMCVVVVAVGGGRAAPTQPAHSLCSSMRNDGLQCLDRIYSVNR